MNLSYERLQYLRKIPNWIEVALYISTIIFVINIDSEYNLVETWQWKCGVVVIWLAWIVFFIKLMNIPKMGYYLIMMGKVTMTWIYFGMVFLVFIFAFTIILYLLFMNHASFHTLFLSLMSTIFMLILSYNWSAVVKPPCDPYNNTQITEGPEAECFDYHGMSAGYQIGMLIIATMVIAMPIVIVNMLIALSVDDVCAVSQEANLKKIAIRVRQSLSSIYKLPNKYRVDTMNVPAIKFILNPKYYRSWWDKVLNNEIKLEELEQKSVVVELYEEVNDRSTTVESHISDLSTKISNLTEKLDDQDDRFKSLFTRLNNGIEKQRPGAGRRQRFLTHT
ncbi:Oidioi.mRNA.OKI2018_I69.chr1.g800.t1.cds [Oikopleura dioica]|uniref:Oidioi.mRNA.OKI2018_I69.chr1.g800.t1.cds n=1 Tax=Oikopleura dioica TaxID=34765 RepID=A0ABN7ST56_OIKDI|nr:Oidioi.mRNA.OKI2018_I69.chr1.g800.t1.cds [Oikopleura dioica]